MEDHDHAGEHPADTQPVNLRMPSFLGAVRVRHLITVLISQGIAYVTLLALAVLACLMLLLSTAVGSDLAEFELIAEDFGGLVGPPDFTDVLAAFGIPFQVAALWLLGALRTEVGMPDFFAQMFAQFGGPSVSAELSFSFWVPNLLVLLAALWAAVWAGRRFASRGEVPLTRLPMMAKLVVSVVVSAVLAGFTLLLTWALAFRQSLDLAEALGGEMSATELETMSEFLGVQVDNLELTYFSSAAGWSLFWGAWGFYLLIGLLISTKKGLFGATFARLSSILPFIRRTPRVIAVHSLVIVIPALIYVCIRLLAEGSSGMLLAIPFWGSSVAVAAFILLTSGAIHGSGQIRETMGLGGQSESGSMTFYLWSGGAPGLQDELMAEEDWIFRVLGEGFAWWEVLISIVIGLIALFLASLTWSLARQSGERAPAGVASFLTLPLVYAIFGAALTLFGQMRIDGSMMDLMTGQAALGPAWWSFLILLVLGAIIEALARVCSAFISDSVPQPLRRILAGKSSSAPARYPGSPAPNAGNSPTMP